IDVTFDRTVTLTGLDGEADNPQAVGGFIISDGSNEGTWYLLDSDTYTAGTHSIPFRSKNYGLYQPAIGTITTMVTIVPGVTHVINSVAPTTLGEEQETDAEFKIRRSRSTVRPGQNNIDALYAEIMNMDTVTDCMAWVNNTDTTDATGTSPYTVWIIVEGGTNSDIGAAIYQYSCGMATRGEISVNNYSIAGQLFETNFDRAVPVPLYIKFDYQTKEYVAGSLLDSLSEEIAKTLSFTLNEDADVSKVNAFAYEANTTVSYNLGQILNLEISTDGETYTDFIKCASMKNKFVCDVTKIEITNVLESST
ncbi:MAG: hypothetical protein IIT65_09615, partial [Lachnospiraceae bacterium]|nr:hypothetical protein [Lachnospiraceae bacterium]